jgi:sugar lactone lactonase YvrE
MPDRTVEVVLRSADQLGECPVWDEREHAFYRVDAVAGAVLRLDVDTGAERRYDLGRRVGCVVLREDGDDLLLGLQEGFGALDTDAGAVTILSHVGHDIARMQLNDGACDPAGRFFAGSIARDAARGLGVLYRYQPPSEAAPVLTGIGVSNGLAWDCAGTTFYLIDSLERRIDRFHYDAMRATVSDRRPAFDVAMFDGIPDGMEIDADDCLWVTFWRGGAVRRFTPDGRLLDEITLPVRRTTSCCLGGPDGTTVFVTTALRSLRNADDPEPLGGAVFATSVNVPGVSARRWRPDPTSPGVS